MQRKWRCSRRVEISSHRCPPRVPRGGAIVTPSPGAFALPWGSTSDAVCHSRACDLRIVRAFIYLVLASVIAWLGVAWFAAQRRIDMRQEWSDSRNPFTPLDVQAPGGLLSR
jgi:hypothetical protein